MKIPKNFLFKAAVHHAVGRIYKHQIAPTVEDPTQRVHMVKKLAAAFSWLASCFFAKSPKISYWQVADALRMAASYFDHRHEQSCAVEATAKTDGPRAPAIRGRAKIKSLLRALRR